ncbi:ABC transporter ATP-binding protein [Clostridium cochlearium]|uniref:ABC transport system ATP-binding protein n=1 Tax=Clostridium cochlearium TaxID=1494 RepID=A0A239ZB43_CLOCO|nr:ABC transporter ATP-binding protein [Clostridium cochlearium]MBV1820778.1 ABC transporter ATP-binding protein [Bacteroidales bacterium MSK.15.36]NSJ92190.1 ABC transporter ATP-binding protein [Coprococcus sp. MSK.21.13]MBE6065431.1 ABC transporter ATP-binding protein [Clostridium cochlearium]MDU1443508.1 ABC transporter ATP-binding protein [Clostridium cochlearium]NMA58222.1 ABC transporter ATP-binding protein [Clostridium cochlearium]
MIIKLEDIEKVYDTGAIKLKALNKINLAIDEREFVAIMGASGSGKSTMMNILGCLDSITSGKYYLDGVDISSLDSNELAEIRNKKIGFVFQAFNLLPKLTSIANVELPMMYAGVPKEERKIRAQKALERVGLKDRIYHKPTELSGGQKQRVAIARALVNDPSILLADEPTGNLDSKSTVEIMGIFQELNNEGVTIVMVTHEDDVAMHTKRAVVFKDGNIISDKLISESERIIVGRQKI